MIQASLQDSEAGYHDYQKTGLFKTELPKVCLDPSRLQAPAPGDTEAFQLFSLMMYGVNVLALNSDSVIAS